MKEKVKFGSVTQVHPLDGDGSNVSVTMQSNNGMVQPLKLVYTIRHRVNNSAEEQDVYRIFDERHALYPLFDSGITFEKKNPLNKGPYYMVEHFTMYKKPEELDHIKAFVLVERRELGL